MRMDRKALYIKKTGAFGNNNYFLNCFYFNTCRGRPPCLPYPFKQMNIGQPQGVAPTIKNLKKSKCGYPAECKCHLTRIKGGFL